jgi:energy-coupling factor transporter ATP-binding protein EcfA2
LTEDLGGLASALEGLDLRGTHLVGDDLTPDRDRLSAVVRNYLIPRVESPDEPLLVVVAGPTGSGKSTLVNSLAGLDLSKTGPLRPTTKVPLVLTRTGRHESGMSVGGVECEVRMGEAPILHHMSLVDTPDIDSTATEHREVAVTLIDHADIVVFVASALRYADAVPWDVLRRALSRGTTVIPVLNRVSSGADAALLDFRALLAGSGLTEEPLRVPEHHLERQAQKIPSLAVRDLRRRLFGVARDRQAYQRGVVNRVMNITLEQTRDLAARADEAGRLLEHLAEITRSACAEASALGDEPRPWAALDLPPQPARAWRLERWRRRVEPSPADLAIYLRRIADSLTAELMSRARILVRSRLATPAALSGIPSILTEAVGGWLAMVRETVSGTPHPRLDTMLTVSRALAHDGGSDAEARVDLQRRVDVVFTHIGERLVELEGMTVPETTPLARRLEAVARSYQFADA